jgi:hypothetical protein
LHSNGDVRLQYHFKNVASAASVKYAIGCAIRDGLPGEPAHAFGAIHDGKINPAADPNHTADFDETHNQPLVAQYWSEIIAGDLVMHCEVQAGFDLGGMFDFLVGVLQKYGPLIKLILWI